MIYVFLATKWSGLSLKQRLYLVLAWMPKGTLQAALCPVALETALSLEDSSLYEQSYDIMCIVSTGICLWSVAGPILLKAVGSNLLK